MMLDDAKVQELVDVFEEVFDRLEQSKEISKGARQMLKDYADGQELDPKALKQVYSQYQQWRLGKLPWGEDGPDEPDYTSILITVMDKVTSR